MTAHKHAALMLQYAQDAAETDRPWERWEVSDAIKYDSSRRLVRNWRQLEDNPDWNANVQYRRKPQVIRVGRHEFPKPITEAPLAGVTVYNVQEHFDHTVPHAFQVAEEKFDPSNPFHKWYVRAGLSHLTGAAAQAHADTLNAICRGDIE